MDPKGIFGLTADYFSKVFVIFTANKVGPEIKRMALF